MVNANAYYWYLLVNPSVKTQQVLSETISVHSRRIGTSSLAGKYRAALRSQKNPNRQNRNRDVFLWWLFENVIVCVPLKDWGLESSLCLKSISSLSVDTRREQGIYLLMRQVQLLHSPFSLTPESDSFSARLLLHRA